MTEVAKRRWLGGEALRLLRVWHVLLQIVLAVVVFALGVVWLRLPDSSGFWLVITVLLGLVVLLLACGGEAALLLSMAHEPRSVKRLLRGAGLMLLLVALWWGWGALLGHHGDDDLRASYLNSKLPRAMRYVFTYLRIELLQRWFWDALAWIGTGVMAAALLPLIVVNRPWRATGIALRSVSFWLVLLATTLGASVMTGALLQWTPGHGLKVEALSLVLRLLVCVVVDAAVACVLLAMIAAAVRRAQSAGEDGP